MFCTTEYFAITSGSIMYYTKHLALLTSYYFLQRYLRFAKVPTFIWSVAKAMVSACRWARAHDCLVYWFTRTQARRSRRGPWSPRCQLKTTLPQSCRLGYLKNHLWIHEPNHVQCQFFHWLVPNSHDCWVSISESGTRTLEPAVGLQRWVKLWAPSCVGRIMCKETDLSGETLPLLQPLPSMFAAPAPWFFSSGEGYRENMGSSARFCTFHLSANAMWHPEHFTMWSSSLTFYPRIFIWQAMTLQILQVCTERIWEDSCWGCRDAGLVPLESQVGLQLDTFDSSFDNIILIILMIFTYFHQVTENFDQHRVGRGHGAMATTRPSHVAPWPTAPWSYPSSRSVRSARSARSGDRSGDRCSGPSEILLMSDEEAIQRRVYSQL